MQTPPTARIAGVNDEPSQSWDLDEGLDVLDELGVKFIELRAAYGEMVDQMDEEGFGNCSNHGECEAVCPKQISISTIALMKREYMKAALTAS